MTPISRSCGECGRPLTVRQTTFCSKRCAWKAGHDLEPCGTEAAIRRHYKRGEPVDDKCRAARSRIEADRRAGRRAS